MKKTIKKSISFFPISQLDLKLAFGPPIQILVRFKNHNWYEVVTYVPPWDDGDHSERMESSILKGGIVYDKSVISHWAKVPRFKRDPDARKLAELRAGISREANN